MGKEEQLSVGMLYGQGGKVSSAGADRLSKDIIDHQEDRRKLSRRRMTAERFGTSIAIFSYAFTCFLYV